MIQDQISHTDRKPETAGKTGRNKQAGLLLAPSGFLSLHVWTDKHQNQRQEIATCQKKREKERQDQLHGVTKSQAARKVSSMIHRLRQWSGFSCTEPIVIPRCFTIPASGLRFRILASASFNRCYLVVPPQDGLIPHPQQQASSLVRSESCTITASCMHALVE